MSERQQWPVSPQELREYADDYERRAHLHSRRDLQAQFQLKATKLRALADWLENPAPVVTPCCDPSAPIKKCVICERDVHTCERREAVDGNYSCPAHPDGVELSDGGQWVCSQRCWDVACEIAQLQKNAPAASEPTRGAEDNELRKALEYIESLVSDDCELGETQIIDGVRRKAKAVLGASPATQARPDAEVERLTAELAEAHELRAYWEQAAIKYQRERSHATEALIRMYNPTQRAKVERILSVADEFHEKWEMGEKERDRLTAELEEARRLEVELAEARDERDHWKVCYEVISKKLDSAREQCEKLARLLQRAMVCVDACNWTMENKEFDVERKSLKCDTLAALKGQEVREP